MHPCVYGANPKWVRPSEAIPAAHLGPCSMNGGTEGLRGAETHLMPSAALDQTQAPAPATALWLPPGLLTAQPSEPRAWGHSGTETLATP